VSNVLTNEQVEEVIRYLKKKYHIKNNKEVQMSPLKRLLNFLDSQDHVPVEARDYDSVRNYTVQRDMVSDKDIHVTVDQVLFVFDKYERFLGIVNFK